MREFKIILLGIFVFFAIIGLILFSTYRAPNNNIQIEGEIVIWGYLEKNFIDEIVRDLEEKQYSLDINYIVKTKETIYRDLVKILALGGDSPDLIILENEDLLKFEDFLFKIPYSSYSVQDYKLNFIQSAEILLKEEGILGLPLISDPLVLYYNRDILNKNKILNPPKNWQEFIDIANRSKSINSSDKITVSGAGLGETKNISNFKEILLTLFFQSQINFIQFKDNLFQTNKKSNLGEVLNFYTSFSNPDSSNYNWNKAFSKQDKKSFTENNLLFYFGFASEFSSFREKNPLLNFSVSLIPQPKNNEFPITYSKLTSIHILDGSDKKNDALKVLNLLIGDEVSEFLIIKHNLPPVRKNKISLYDNGSSTAVSVFSKSNLSSKNWYDPDGNQTKKLFEELIEDYKSIYYFSSFENDLERLINGFWRKLSLIINEKK